MDGKKKTEQQQEDQGSKGGQAGDAMDQQYEDQDAFIEQNETDNPTEDTGRGLTNR